MKEYERLVSHITREWIYDSANAATLKDECGEVYSVRRNIAGIEEHATMRVIKVPRDAALANAVRADPTKYSSERFAYAGTAYAIVEEAKSIAQKCTLEVVAIEDADIASLDEHGIAHAAWLVTKAEKKKRLNPQSVPRDQAIVIAQNLCKAVRALEKAGAVFPCLLPSSVFVDDDGEVSIESVSAVQQAYSNLSCCRYCAPETRVGGESSHAATVYSIGAITYEMLIHSDFVGTVKHYHDEVSDVLARACSSDSSERFANVEVFCQAIATVQRRNEDHPIVIPTERLDERPIEENRHKDQLSSDNKSHNKLFWLLVPVIVLAALILYPAFANRAVNQKQASNLPVTTAETTAVSVSTVVPSPTPTSSPSPTPARTHSPSPTPRITSQTTNTPKPTATPSPSPSPITTPDLTPVVFYDSGFENAFRERYSLVGDIYESTIKGFTELDLSNEGLTDIRDLSKFTELTKLYLNFNRIKDVEPLRALIKLKELRIHSNYEHLSDIDALRDLTDLEILYVHANSISRIDALKNLTKLKTLALGYNRISNIEVLSGLRNLEVLYIQHNSITDISALRALPLKNLCLQRNKSRLVNLDVIGEIKTLTDLDLCAMNAQSLKDSDISFLSALDNLRRLEIRENGGITTLPLDGLKSIEEVFVYGTSISSAEQNRFLLNHPNCTIDWWSPLGN